MQTITKDSAAPSVSGREPATTQVPYDEKKVSADFQHKEAGDQQGMPLMWPISEVLCGAASAGTPNQTAPGVHPVSEKNRADLLSQKNIIPALRAEAKEILTLLSRYDEGLSIRDAQVLLNVVNILDQAVIVA